MAKKPLIAITCDSIINPKYPDQYGYFSQDKYSKPVVDIMDCTPLIIPNIPTTDIDTIANTFDGFIFTGSPSNIAAELYGKDKGETPENERDIARDYLTIPLIKKIIEKQKPMLCICRGMQELNVAMGGSLQRNVHISDKYEQHMLPLVGNTFDELYKVRQNIKLCDDGVLAKFNKGNTDMQVNSIHGQAVDKIGDGLCVEAVCQSDGIVEAMRIENYKTFAMAVQWHPEHWEALQHSLNKQLFIELANWVKGK